MMKKKPQSPYLFITLVSLLIFICCWIETALLPMHIVAALVLAWTLARDERQGLGIAFVAGLVLDGLVGNRIGTHALVFLLYGLLLLAMRRVRLLRGVAGMAVAFPVFVFATIDWLARLLEFSTRSFIINLPLFVGDLIVWAICLISIVILLGPKEREVLRLKMS